MDYKEMLTKGALNAIMNNEVIKDPILQVLAICKNIAADSSSVQYQLLISDGQNCFHFAILKSRLNSMILTRKLTAFSVVKINHYSFTKCTDSSEGTQQVMTFIDLDVLLRGNVVCAIIGNPKPTIDNSDNIQNLLTKDNSSAILNDEEVDEVFQIIGFRKITAEGEIPCYQYYVSVGQNLNSLVKLTRELDSMILSGNLNEFSFIKIKHYIIRRSTTHSDREFVLNGYLVTLVPGPS